MKFSVSPPLGKLAKWLRIMGYDSLYPVILNDIDDTSVTVDDLSDPDERIYIVRRHTFRGRPVVFLDQNLWEDQLRLLNLLLPIYENRCSFTRCIDCNRPVETVNRDDVADLVPEYVSGVHTEFTRCPECKKILWPGTHRDNMEVRIARIFSPS
ncbi:MAG: hypothetical protein JW885_06630 [Deltaproteobacteria bacterium]|nr:hypothetical protein [Candidatus Zymogenaceae bacterium]